MGKQNRIRWSLFTYVFGSALGLIGLLMRGPVPLPNGYIGTWAVAVSSEKYFAAQALTLLA